MSRNFYSPSPMLAPPTSAFIPRPFTSNAPLPLRLPPTILPSPHASCQLRPDMPSFAFDAFRSRLRSKSVPTPAPPSSEKDSLLSSPTRDQSRIKIHIAMPKNGRKSGEHLVNIPDSGKLSPGTAKEKMGSKQAPLTQDNPSRSAIERPSRKPSKPDTSVSLSPNAHPPSSSHQVSPPSRKPTLLRRVTSKLTISIPYSKPHNSGMQSQPPLPASREDVKHPIRLPSPPRIALPVSPTLPNSFISKECREAALRERGLLPPRKDLSQQEREADERLGCVSMPPDAATDSFSEAERLKEIWYAMNPSSDSSASDCGPTAPPHLECTATSPHSMLESASPIDPSCRLSISDADSSCQSSSCEGNQKADMPSAGMRTTLNTLPRLSTSSCLEVLHEDPSEQGPITPSPLSPARLPIIISTPVEDEFPCSPMDVESPVSCSRTTGSADRRQKAKGSTLSTFRNKSLTSLRRSNSGKSQDTELDHAFYRRLAALTDSPTASCHSQTKKGSQPDNAQSSKYPARDERNTR
ncbi:hypothetical protein BU15DRAFT_72065 [Melanogaster broomeanus]|nr:hypothetical protein BU15DRAFT_72065 [Melanogaster broomeanus]